jgi:hypothetical protein
MRRPLSSVALLALVTLTTATLAAQAPPPTPSRQKLLEEIRRAQAVRVDPRVIRQAAATAPAQTPAPAAGGATPTAPAASPTAGAEAPPQAVATVKKGQLLYVPLEVAQEAQARQLLAEQIAATEPQRQGSLETFQGAVRQLSADDEEVQLKAYVLVGQPLRYVPERKTFEGNIVVGVADLQNQGGPRSLTVPLQFQVLESEAARPDHVSLGETSPPYQRIGVTSSVIGQPVTLHIASNFSLEGVQVSVPVEPTLLVSIDGDDLRAFGMQTAEVTVTAVGGTAPPSGQVTLRAPGAFLVNGSQATFDASGVATAIMRTDRTGTVDVTATASGYTPGADHVTVIWPWPTLVATCLGGLIGGFVRLAPKIRKRMNVTQFIVGLVASVFVGVIVFALYLVGVKVLPVTFSVEVGDIFAFAAAGLAGWLGSRALTPKAA